MKKKYFFTVIAIFAIVIIILFSSSDKILISKKLGVLEGVVHFSGVACAPDRIKTPPCDGPYPDYDVIVYDKEGKIAIAKTRTDQNGYYQIILNEGTYILYVQEVDFNIKPVSVPKKIFIFGDTQSTFNINIRSGIR